jgi:hypothetical protein
MDQCKAVEAGRTRSQSRGPALCQALGLYRGGIGTFEYQSTSNSGCPAIPSTPMDTLGGQTNACLTATKIPFGEQ